LLAIGLTILAIFEGVVGTDEAKLGHEVLGGLLLVF